MGEYKMEWGRWQSCFMHEYNDRVVCIRAKVTGDLQFIMVYLEDIKTYEHSGESLLSHSAFTGSTAAKRCGTRKRKFGFEISEVESNTDACYRALVSYMQEKESDEIVRT
jgi:uncharacterized protein Yka (UPF0111/DUF47 family)